MGKDKEEPSRRSDPRLRTLVRPLDGWRACWKMIWKSMTWQNKRKRGLEESDICLLCDRETENIFHVLCRCPLTIELWQYMSSVCRLQEIKDVCNTGSEWLLDVLHPLAEIDRCMVMMTLWRSWHNRNEVVHNKIPPPMEVQRTYLCSYLEALLAIAQNSVCYPVKGKGVISYDHLPKISHVIMTTNSSW